MNVADRTPAEVYEALFVPALFQQWGPIIADAAEIVRGQSVLDVASGTGVLACYVLDRVKPEGRVVGLDVNADMIAVARRKNSNVEWIEGRAESLPFADETFHAVVSQFGLMFFDDRATALREMMRVLKRGGRLAVAVCDALDHSPGYAALAQLLQRLFGHRIADAFRAPFMLGNPSKLATICAEAGLLDAKVEQHLGTVQFASIKALISTERACVWTLGGLLDEAQFGSLLDGAEQSLKPFTTADGRISFKMPALIIKASKD
jgi:SAM-dependent methyltransferase